MKNRIFPRVAALLLALLTLFSCSACALFGGKSDTPADFELTDAEGKACTIVYPDGAKAAEWKALANRLARAIRRVTGATPDVVSDSNAEGERELLLGPTNRAASGAAIAQLEANKCSFRICVTEGKLVLAAPDARTTELVMAYFETQATNKLGGVQEGSRFTLSGSLDHTYTVPSSASTPGELLINAASADFRADEAFTAPVSGTYNSVASLAVQENKLFVALKAGNGNAKLQRYERTASKPEQSSEALPLGDAVSMCYNSALNLLAIAHGQEKKISFVDPDSLTIVYTVTMKEEPEAIDYDAVGRCFAVKFKDSNDIRFYDNALAEADTFTLAGVDAAQLSSGAVSLADMTTDGSFVYLLYAATQEALAPQTILVSLSITGTRRLISAIEADTLPLSLSVSERIFYAAFAATEAGAAEIKRISISSATVANEPFSLFNETNTATADDTYLSSAPLFYAHSFIKNTYARNTVLQGACTDGTFGYYFLEYQGGTDANGNSNYSNSETHDTVIVKVDMQTMEMVAHSAPLKLGHSNDGCYNPHTKKILVVYNGNSKKRVIAVDPGTLTIDEEASVTLDINIFAMSYNEQTGQYIVGRSGGRDIGILDENFNLIKTFETSKLGAPILFDYQENNDRILTQGIDADSKYIYFVLSAQRESKGNWTNYLVVFDYDGNYIFTKVLPDMINEVENIFHIGSRIFIGCNGGSSANRNPCYELTVTQVP